MAYNEDFIIFTHGVVTQHGIIIVDNSEFETGKEYYTINYHCVSNRGTDDFTYHIYTRDNKLPAVRLGGENLANLYGCPFANTSDSIIPYLSVFTYDTNNNRVISNVRLYSHTGDNVFDSFGGLGQNVIYRSGYYTDGNILITITADFPIFAPDKVLNTQSENLTIYTLPNDANIQSYISEVMFNDDYSNINKAINYTSLTNAIPTDITYFIRSTLKVNGTPTTSKGYCFQILPDAKICLYQDDNITGDGSPNLHLVISQYPCLVKGYTDSDEDYTESSNPDTEYWHSGYWRDIDTGINYTGICSTNIPIFRGQENAQKYLDGELSESDALNGGSISNKYSTIGGELEGTDIPTVNLSTSGVGTYIYALSETQIKNLMTNYLYVTDATLLQNISDALWLWGNNPIDFFIDCYYIPFDITNFYTTVNADMKFGTYRFESAQGWSTFPVVQETNGQRLTLFNTTFEGIYGDWRDYSQFEYDLFLPFYGFFKLDLYKYLNHVVRCEMMFDVTTHNLRYYLFVDDVITDRIDSSVGINLPLMSSDYVNKAKSDRQARRESDRTAYRAMGAFLTGGLAVAGGIASGNASYAVNGGTSAITSVIDAKYNLDALADKVNENATQSVEGAYSSSMNIYDIRYAYLRITESELIIPDKLNELYGYPSYYMGSASALSGYCEISDIRLKSFTGTVEELNALKGALREGVIL